MPPQGPRKVGAADGPVAQLGGCDARFLVWSEESGGGFSLVEHPIPAARSAPRCTATSASTSTASCWRGGWGALLGDEVIYAEAGELAFKPRDQWHTFWNAGDGPARILEVISPGGFEHFFREFDETTKDGSFDPEALSERYGIEFDMESVPRICREHDLTHPLLG
jgi:hypothetical protein